MGYEDNKATFCEANTRITFPTEVTIAAAFYSDHVARDCGQTGVLVKQSKTKVTVLLDAEAWDDLYSDALYYVDYLDEDVDADTKAFARTALRVVNVMDKHTNKG
jgi:hypothetical protein